MLATSFNQLMKDRDIPEDEYYQLLAHLTEPSLALCCPRTQYYGTLPFIKKYYEEYQKRERRAIQQEWKKRGITGLSSIQKYTQLYLYWILDASAARFKEMDTDTRMKLFSRVFGSVNQWQPLTINEVSCIGTPGRHTVVDIINRGRWEILENPEEVDTVVEKTRKNANDERERLSYAKVLTELTSDEPSLDADISGWIEKQITAAKKETSQPMFKAYEISCFSDYILLQLRLLTEKSVIVKRCKNCGQYFITERSNIDYCQRILPGEIQTCYVIGPKRVFNKNLAADLPRGLYSKAYKKYQARLRRQGITEEEWESWKEQAKQMLDDVQNGRISIDAYTEWMEK